METKEIPIKYRAICPDCKSAYDMRRGGLVKGHLYCSNCAAKIQYKYYIHVPQRNHK